MADNKHLQKRGDSWTYCRRVLTRLIPILGRRFIKKALGTSDIKVARALRNVENVRVDALFAQIEAGAIGAQAANGTARPSTADVSMAVLEQHVRAAVEVLDRRSADRLAADPAGDGDELREMRENAETELSILRNPDDPARHELIAHFGDRVLEDTGAELEGREAWSRFGELVRRASIELQRRKLDRYDVLL